MNDYGDTHWYFTQRTHNQSWVCIRCSCNINQTWDVQFRSCVYWLHPIIKDLKIHMIIICWRFHINAPFRFRDMRTWDMWKVCLQTFRNNRIRYKLAYFLRNLQTSRVNNLIILRIKNVKCAGYCFYMNTII